MICRTNRITSACEMYGSNQSNARDMISTTASTLERQHGGAVKSAGGPTSVRSPSSPLIRVNLACSYFKWRFCCSEPVSSRVCWCVYVSNIRVFTRLEAKQVGNLMKFAPVQAISQYCTYEWQAATGVIEHIYGRNDWQ